jgi:hypothetical protein
MTRSLLARIFALASGMRCRRIGHGVEVKRDGLALLIAGAEDLEGLGLGRRQLHKVHVTVPSSLVNPPAQAKTLLHESI